MIYAQSSEKVARHLKYYDTMLSGERNGFVLGLFERRIIDKCSICKCVEKGYDVCHFLGIHASFRLHRKYWVEMTGIVKSRVVVIKTLL